MPRRIPGGVPFKKRPYSRKCRASPFKKSGRCVRAVACSRAGDDSLEQEEACTKAPWFIDNVKTIPHPDDAYLIVKEFLATFQPDHGWLNPVSPADPNYNLYGKQTRLTGLYRIYSSFLREVLLFCEHNPAGFANRYFPGHDLFVHENNIVTLGSEYLCRGHHIIYGVRPPSSLEGKTWEAFDMK